MVTDQLWYEHDYWYPPVLLPAHMALIEDALYGFAATALAACAVAYLVPPPWARSRRTYQKGRRPRHAFAWLATTLLAYVTMIGPPRSIHDLHRRPGLFLRPSQALAAGLE
jgi:hypothetical protein